MENWMKSSFLNQENVKVKPAESYKQLERYQAGIVLLPNYERGGFKYLYTTMDHFTKTDGQFH